MPEINRRTHKDPPQISIYNFNCEMVLCPSSQSVDPLRGLSCIQSSVFGSHTYVHGAPVSIQCVLHNPPTTTPPSTFNIVANLGAQWARLTKHFDTFTAMDVSHTFLAYRPPRTFSDVFIVIKCFAFWHPKNISNLTLSPCLTPKTGVCVDAVWI